MKSGVAILVLMVAGSAFAGLTYEVQTQSNGAASVGVSGRVVLDGTHLRMDVVKGDSMMFNDGAIVLSSDGGQTMSVYDPAAKHYYNLRLDSMLSSAMSMLQAAGTGLKVSFSNPQVSVRDGGDGGTLDGYPTHRYVIDASYDITLDAMGNKMNMHTTMTTESWTTDRISTEFLPFIQMHGIHTGIAALDTMLDAQRSAVKGFPLKQVSTVHSGRLGQEAMTIVNTVTVSHVQEKAIDPAQFTSPAGYTKVDDPITAMLGKLKM